MSDSQPLDVGQLEAEFRDVRLPMGLVIDRAIVTAAHVHLEKKPFIFQMPEPGALTVHISEGNLAAFLNERSPGGLRDFEIRLADGLVTAYASMKVIVTVRAKAVCRLVVQDGTQLFVQLDSVDVMGVGAKNMVQAQLDQINPVLDLAEFPVEGVIDSVAIDSGFVMIQATVRPKIAGA